MNEHTKIKPPLGGNRYYNKGRCNTYMKTCSVCKQTLLEDSFHKRTYKSGRVATQSKCKACQTKVRKQYYRPHSAIRQKLKLSQAEVDRLLAPGECQNPACRSKDRRLCIDHNHDTEKPRGLLCHNCNTALGLLDDNTQVILGLSQYLAQREPLV